MRKYILILFFMLVSGCTTLDISNNDSIKIKNILTPVLDVIGVEGDKNNRLVITIKCEDCLRMVNERSKRFSSLKLHYSMAEICAEDAMKIQKSYTHMPVSTEIIELRYLDNKPMQSNVGFSTKGLGFGGLITPSSSLGTQEVYIPFYCLIDYKIYTETLRSLEKSNNKEQLVKINCASNPGASICMSIAPGLKIE